MNLFVNHRAARRALQAAPLAGAVALLALCGSLAAPKAMAGDAFENDFMNNTMQMLGLKEEEKPEIEYRERAPLVVPPSGASALPQPQQSPHAANPNWPKDPDLERRRQEAAKENAPIVRDDPGRPLMPSELNKGRRKTNVYSSDPAAGEASTLPLSPAALGFKGWFNPSESKDKITFNGEPQRESLVQPPPGYQTPAPNAPYGEISPKKEEFKFPTLFNRDTPTQ